MGNCCDHYCIMSTELKLLILDYLSNETASWGCDEIYVDDTPENRELFKKIYEHDYIKTNWEIENFPDKIIISLGLLVDFWKKEIKTLEN